MPALDFPVGVITGPFGHFELPVGHALLCRDAFGLEIQADILAAGRLINHADRNDKLNHGAPQSRCEGHSRE